MAAAETSTVPSPCPEVPALMASHCPSTDADQEHSRAADTLKLRLPPCAGTCPSPLTVTEQRLIGEGPVDVAVVAEEPQPARPARASHVAARWRAGDE